MSDIAQRNTVCGRAHKIGHRVCVWGKDSAQPLRQLRQSGLDGSIRVREKHFIQHLYILFGFSFSEAKKTTKNQKKRGRKRRYQKNRRSVCGSKELRATQPALIGTRTRKQHSATFSVLTLVICIDGGCFSDQNRQKGTFHGGCQRRHWKSFQSA